MDVLVGGGGAGWEEPFFLYYSEAKELIIQVYDPRRIF
jgi:hypothetical protein